MLTEEILDHKPTQEIEESKYSGGNTFTSKDFEIQDDFQLFENVELSNLEIGHKGIVGWTNVENVRAEILEINNDWVSLECQVDADLKHYEIRNFTKRIFNKLSKLEIGQDVLIRYYEGDDGIKINIEQFNQPNTKQKTSYGDRFRRLVKKHRSS